MVNEAVRQEEGGLSNTPRTRTLRGENRNNDNEREVKLLQCRVDTLQIAFRIKTRGGWLIEFFESLRNHGGVSSIEREDIALKIKSFKRYGKAKFENADVRGVFDESASNGWKVDITVSAIYLATHSLNDAILLVRRIADIFGIVLEERVRRIDLCADIANWIFEVDEGGAWVGLGKRTVRTHRVNGKITGYSICPGNPLTLRIYDKLTELQQQGQEAKRDVELSIYKRNGWQGEGVSRVEFQIRSECIKQLGLRNPNEIIDKIDAVWAYCTRKWVRLVDLETAKEPRRCKVDPRWETVRSVVFIHGAEPAERIRKRDGVGLGQVIGANMSYLGARGRLAVLDDDKALADVNSVDKESARRQLINIIDIDLNGLKDQMLSDLVERFGEVEALKRLRTKRFATIARFSSSDSGGLR